MNATINIGDKLPEMIIGPFEADDLKAFFNRCGLQAINSRFEECSFLITCLHYFRNGRLMECLTSFKITFVRTNLMPGRRNMKSSRKML